MLNEAAAGTPARSLSRRGKVALWLSGLIPLIGLFRKPPGTALLIYTLVVAAVLLRKPVVALADRMGGRPAPFPFRAFLVSGCLTEYFARLNNYLAAAPKPALFHPQLLTHLLLGRCFYGA